MPQALIGYEFGDRTAQVSFEETPDGVLVRVSFDSENTFPIKQQQEGWQSILDNFKKHVEQSAK